MDCFIHIQWIQHRWGIVKPGLETFQGPIRVMKIDNHAPRIMKKKYSLFWKHLKKTLLYPMIKHGHSETQAL